VKKKVSKRDGEKVKKSKDDQKSSGFPTKPEKDSVKDIIDGMVGEDSGKVEGISQKDISVKVEPLAHIRYRFNNTNEMAQYLNNQKVENRKLQLMLERIDNIWHKEYYKKRTLMSIVQDIGAKIDSTCEKIDAKFITLIDEKDSLRHVFYSNVKNSIVFNNLRKHMLELKEDINIATSEKSVREALKTTGDTFKVMEMLRK